MMQPDRTIQPELYPVQHVELNVPEHFRLDNGIPVWYLNLGSQDVVRAEFIFPAGNACHNNQLMPSLCNTMLQEGTRKKSAAEISDAIDRYGAFLELDTEFLHQDPRPQRPGGVGLVPDSKFHRPIS